MDNIPAAIESFKQLDSAEANFVLMQLLHEGKIDIPQLVSVYAEHLAKFKRDAQQDIQILAEAGLSLGEDKINKIKTIKNDRKKQVSTAQANTLLQAGFRGTPFNESLSRNVDMSTVDKNWYEACWALKTVKKPEDSHKPNPGTMPEGS